MESKGQLSDILEPFPALANSPSSWFVWYREIMAAVQTARRKRYPFSVRVKHMDEEVQAAGVLTSQKLAEFEIALKQDRKWLSMIKDSK